MKQIIQVWRSLTQCPNLRFPRSCLSPRWGCPWHIARSWWCIRNARFVRDMKRQASEYPRPDRESDAFQSRWHPEDRALTAWSRCRLWERRWQKWVIGYPCGSESPEPITGIRSSLPPELERIINKMLSKKINERYVSVEDLLVDLQKVSKEIESGIKTSASKNNKKSSNKKRPTPVNI